MIDIILLEPEHEGNIGAVCRVMSNFNFKNLIIINPQCNLKGDQLIRRAKHSTILKSIKIRKTIPKYNLLIGTTSKVFSDYNVARSPLNPEQLAEKLSKTRGKIGIVFGRESIGLTNEEIKKCNFLVSIDTSKKYPVLNLSHAVSIISYELYKKIGKNKLTKGIIPAGNKEKEQIQKMINKIIDQSIPTKKTIQKTIWKNIFNKSMMTKREAFGVMGLLNKIQKTIKNLR